MSDWPLEFIYRLPPRPPGLSLGDWMAQNVTDNGKATTLLDCLCNSTRPALWSPDLARPPLDHRSIKRFVQSFTLPVSSRARHQPLKPNDRVMLLLPTGPENALMLMSIATYHTCAPLNAACTAGELRDDAVRLRARAVVTTRDSLDRLDCWSLYAEENMEIIVVDFNTSGPAGYFEMSVLEGDNLVPYQQGSQPQCPASTLTDYSLVLHTSGTSGKKKVVPYSLRHMIVGTCCVVFSWELKPDSVNMNMMPLFHVGGIVRNLWSPLFSNGSAIMCAGFDATTWWKLAGELGATWYYAAPTMHHAILASKPEGTVASRDTKIKMICNAAGGLLPSLAVQLKENFGDCAVLPSYGMTECMPIASPPTDYQLDRPGCSGVACGPGLSIRNPFNLEEERPVGETGAVCVRGLPTFSGYETDPDGPLDSSSFSKDGWFDSGDMGHMDADGYLFITGRSKEIINKGGEVISPFEVEEAVTQATTGRVKNTLCFSIEHDVLQETIGVVIVPTPNEPRVGLSELQNMLRNYLHPSKWPFAIVYMDDLPKNQAGKPLRIKLASRLGIGPLTDSVPPLQRHFEAKAPGKEVPLSEPIPCQLVNIDVRAVERACYRIPGIVEAAVRVRKDGAPEAFIYVEEDMPYDAADIDRALAQVLDGYVVPNPLHVFRQPLAKTPQGQIDFDTMDAEVRAQNAQDMSSTGLIVRDIIGKLLNTDPGSITAESDFFLLGGNSLLLGRLVAQIRKETGVSLEVSSLFTNSTIDAIAAMIEDEKGASDDEEDDEGYYDEKTGFSSNFLSAHRYDDDDDGYMNSHGYKPRSQTHPWVMFIQMVPLLFFYPFKAAWTWTVLLHGLAFSAYYIDDNFWERVGVLLLSLFVARLTSRIICPVTAIAFKWLVIGRYRPGKYPMWCNYHLRWWIVNQSLSTAGKGLFNLTPELRKVYYRLLGASIGSNVKIDKFAKLGEYDLLTIHDGAQIDKSVVRGFCVERDGYFRLEPIIIGRDCMVNTYTQISPGARLANGTVWGPQSSSHEEPSSDSYAAYNREAVPKPHWALVVFLGLPLKLVVWVLCYIPWFAALFMLLSTPFLFNKHDSLKGIIAWFSFPNRIGWHYVARIVRNDMPAMSNVILGILLKRITGTNKVGSMRNATQLALWRRWVQKEFLSQPQIRRAMNILGTHYEMTSVIYRAMGAKIGKRVYWPGSGIYCPDPELLEIGDDVVFGSRSEVFTSDSIGWAKVRVARGAMIADRVVLSPGVTIGRQCVMGSGALARRNGYYEPLSVWMGAKHGEAVSFGKSAPSEEVGEDATITPFGRAFYKRQASFFVFPYPMLVMINLMMSVITSLYWASPAVAAITFLNFLRVRFEDKADGLFGDHWYRPALLYIYIALAFVIVMGAQMLLAFAWVIGTKWLIIGRRREGRYDWDKSSYCQRWQLHLVLQKLLGKGFGGHIIGCISGTVYAVWYLRLMGAHIGRDCAIWAGGKPSLQFTEPELVTFGDHVSVDDCSVVAHINSRGRFSLNALRIGDGCAMRTGSRLLSGANMEPRSMLLEHTLVASGEIAEAGLVYAGWPARQLRVRKPKPPPPASPGTTLATGGASAQTKGFGLSPLPSTLPSAGPSPYASKEAFNSQDAFAAASTPPVLYDHQPNRSYNPSLADSYGHGGYQYETPMQPHSAF